MNYKIKINDKIYQKICKYLKYKLKIPQEYMPLIIINKGDKIRYRTYNITPILSNKDAQYILIGDYGLLCKFCENKKIDNFHFKEKDNIYFKNNIYIGNLIDFIVKHIILGIDCFYSCRDFGDNGSDVSCVGYNSKNKTWYGYTYRGIYSYKIGDKFRLSKKLIFLSNGFVEGTENNKKEKKIIDLIKSWAKNGILTIKNDEQAKLIAYKSALSIG